MPASFTRQVIMKANIFHFSAGWLVAGIVIHGLVLGGLTFLFCWAVGGYTLRKLTDVLLTFSFCYMLLGLSIWVGRGMRFYNQSEGFTNLLRVTINDRPELGLALRRRLLWIYENQMFIPWVAVGLVGMALGLLFGTYLTEQFPPDTVLDFLVRQSLNPILKPGGLLHP